MIEYLSYINYEISPFSKTKERILLSDLPQTWLFIKIDTFSKGFVVWQKTGSGLSPKNVLIAIKGRIYKTIVSCFQQ